MAPNNNIINKKIDYLDLWSKKRGPHAVLHAILCHPTLGSYARELHVSGPDLAVFTMISKQLRILDQCLCWFHCVKFTYHQHLFQKLIRNGMN